MGTVDIPSNLKRLRIVRRMTQAETATKAGISRVAYVAIENGKSQPKTSTLLSLADALEAELSAILEPPPRFLSLRFRAGTLQSARERSAKDELLREVWRWLSDYTELEKLLHRRRKTPLLQQAGKGSPEAAARKVRALLGIAPDAPIVGIRSLLETNGVKVMTIDSKLPSFFGLSVGEPSGGPAIVVNTERQITVERQIFTAAHELGHILLHRRSFSLLEDQESRTEEREADSFGAYFLMPDGAFREQWEFCRGMSWVDAVLRVKRIFRVSYMTVLRRLRDIGVADQSIYQRFRGEFKAKYGLSLTRRVEPDSLGTVEPLGMKNVDIGGDRLFALVQEAFEIRTISHGRAAEILRIPENELRDLSKLWRRVK